MNKSTELAETLLAALDTIPGLVPAAPKRVPLVSPIPVRWDTLAVDVARDLVEVRVVATALPLPPLLRRAETVLSTHLSGTAWSSARLRLVVTDIDSAAFGTSCSDTSDGDHPIGS